MNFWRTFYPSAENRVSIKFQKCINLQSVTKPITLLAPYCPVQESPPNLPIIHTSLRPQLTRKSVGCFPLLRSLFVWPQYQGPVLKYILESPNFLALFSAFLPSDPKMHYKPPAFVATQSSVIAQWVLTDPIITILSGLLLSRISALTYGKLEFIMLNRQSLIS